MFANTTELTDPALVTMSAEQVSCDSGAPTAEIETLASGSTSLRYDPDSGQFVLNYRVVVPARRDQSGREPGTRVAVEAMPAPVRPMLATAGPVPADGRWRYEFKWDGVRAIVTAAGDAVRAWSRNDLDITPSYPELAGLPGLVHGRRVVLDGELVALDEAGRPSFALLQERMHVRTPGRALLARVPVRYYVFDVLYLDDSPTLQEPYERRRERLDGLGLPGDPGRDGAVACVPRCFDDAGRTTAAARAFGLEGVVAKRLGSPYRPGERSRDWIKHPFVTTAEVLIIGHRPGRGRRAGTIGSLLIATPAGDGTLRFAGGVGTGFTGADLQHLQQLLAPLRRATPAVPGIPREHSRGATWVEPVVLGEVAYRNRTPDGLLRHPAWRGLRPDKQPPRPAAPPAAPVPAASPVARPVPTAPSVARPVPAAPSVARPVPVAAEVTGSLQTRDGAWRVDIVRRGDAGWYRLVHGDATVDHLQLADLQRLLTTAGLDLADLADTHAA